MNNFRIECACGNNIQNDFQVTINDWEGYSEYTVENYGYFEVKCKKCGAFGTSDMYRYDGANKLDEFTITCAKCESTEVSVEDSLGIDYGDISEDNPYPRLECDACGNWECDEQ